MTTALRCAIVGYLLGALTWQILFPEWALWAAFVLGMLYQLLVFAMAVAFDWSVHRFFNPAHKELPHD